MKDLRRELIKDWKHDQKLVTQAFKLSHRGHRTVVRKATNASVMACMTCMQFNVYPDRYTALLETFPEIMIHLGLEAAGDPRSKP